LVDRDIIFEKIANIQRCLKRIKEKTSLDPNTLEGLDTQEIFILNLQRAIQSAIDLASHVVADEGLGLPGSIKENFSLLQNAGILSPEISVKMQSMVGFRNIAIHEYQNIKPAILKSILEHHLNDFIEFYQQVSNYFKI